MSKAHKYSPEVGERAVRRVQEARKDYPSLWSAVESIAPKIGCAEVTLHEWIKKCEIGTGVRLMCRLGLRGVMRGQVVRTTFSDSAVPCPLDRVNRQFKIDRPNQLWVSDFTYVSTWQGFVYVAFVIDVFARRIVGWRVSRSMRSDFVLDALEQALYARHPERDASLIHHSDRGSQYISIRYTEWLSEAGIEPFVGSKGDSYDNALAETINGLYKAELIHRRTPWKTVESLELATLEWVTWFNHQRILEPIGHIPPTEAEDRYHQQLTAQTEHLCT